MKYDNSQHHNEKISMSKHSWRETAELIGIIAIVASLLALLMELNQTQSAWSAEIYQSRAIHAKSMSYSLSRTAST